MYVNVPIYSCTHHVRPFLPRCLSLIFIKSVHCCQKFDKPFIKMDKRNLICHVRTFLLTQWPFDASQNAMHIIKNKTHFSHLIDMPLFYYSYALNKSIKAIWYALSFDHFAIVSIRTIRVTKDKMKYETKVWQLIFRWGKQGGNVLIECSINHCSKTNGFGIWALPYACACTNKSIYAQWEMWYAEKLGYSKIN